MWIPEKTTNIIYNISTQMFRKLQLAHLLQNLKKATLYFFTSLLIMIFAGHVYIR